MVKTFKYIKFLLPALLVATLVVDAVSVYKFPDLSKYDGTVAQQAQAKAKKPDLKIKDRKKKEEKEPEGTAGELGAIKESGNYADGKYTGSAKGFGGLITVQVTIEGGKITAVKIISAPGEDAPYLAKAKRLTGVIVKKNSTNVDAVSGATYSSNGLIRAVRNALKKAAGKKVAKDITKGKKGKDNSKVLPAADDGRWNDGTYTGTGTGYGGRMTVNVTIKGGKIVSIKLVSHKEDEEFLAKAMKVVPGSIVNSQSTNVDTVSGATYSSNGIIGAVRNALKKAKKKKGVRKDEDSKVTDDSQERKPETDSPKRAQKKQLPNIPATVKNGDWKDGTYTGTGEGFGGNLQIIVTIKDGKIVTLSMGKHEEDEEYYSKARAKIFPAIINKQSTGVDTVSGATYSSVGIIQAVTDALSKAQINPSDSKPGEQGGASEGGNDSTEEQDNPVDITRIARVLCDEDEDFEDYDLTMTFVVQGGKIIDIKDVKQVIDAKINDSYIKAATKGIKRQLASKPDFKGIDTISGATCTSITIIDEALAVLKSTR